MAYQGTNTVLPSNGTWTSSVISSDRQDTITGSVFSDQAGTLFVEQSGDGANWDLSKSVPVTASTGVGFSEAVYLPFVRLRFANGSSAQNAFRVFGRLGSAGDS